MSVERFCCDSRCPQGHACPRYRAVSDRIAFACRGRYIAALLVTLFLYWIAR